MLQAAREMATAPSRLPATAQKSPAPTAVAPGRNPRPLFACGEDVEVRNSLPQVSGTRRLVVVIYVRAKVVSASAGTRSYLVQYPAARSIPSRTARVPASDVRAARASPPPPQQSVADVARPASSKRPTQQSVADVARPAGSKRLPQQLIADAARPAGSKRPPQQSVSDVARPACSKRPPQQSVADVALPAGSKRLPQSDRSDHNDGCKKAKITKTKAIPMEALERFVAERKKEEEARKKARGHVAELLAPKLRPVFVSVL